MSTDGGATWNLLDSTSNFDSKGNFLPIDSTSRDREFVGMTVNKVVVDPKLTPTGQVIIYAAVSGTNGGIWRSEDTGKTWVLMLAGNATDVILDADSAVPLNPDANPGATGNLQVVFAGMQGQGVFMSPNQGQVWNLMAGNVGNPLIIDVIHQYECESGCRRPLPTVPQGRIVFPRQPGPAMPCRMPSTRVGSTRPSPTPTGGFVGLFMTKDFGQNWVQVNIATVPPAANFNQAIPTNDVTQPNYAITLLSQGNLYLTLAVDPTNPNIVYLGSFGNTNNDVAGSYNAQASDTGLIRIDTTNIADAHNLNASSYNIKDGGAVTLTSVGSTTIDSFLLDSSAGWFHPFSSVIQRPM